jgi:hypothetical protein
MTQQRPAAVPVVPNASQIRGRLLQIQPEQGSGGAVWTIAVDEADDVEGMPNFARAHVGQPIEVYVHPELHPALAERDPLEARVAFRGDEQGGRFVIVNDDLHKL